MIIKRTIDNKEYEFELTFAELGRAYHEMKKYNARSAVEWYAPEYLEAHSDEGITPEMIQENVDSLVSEWLDFDDAKYDDESYARADLEYVFDRVLLPL